MLEDGLSGGRYYLGKSELGARAIDSAEPRFYRGEGWAVLLTFTDEGSDRFDAIAAEHLQERIAIVVDGVVESAPTVQTDDFGGSAEITGDFTKKEARRLARRIALAKPAG